MKTWTAAAPTFHLPHPPIIVLQPIDQLTATSPHHPEASQPKAPPTMSAPKILIPKILIWYFSFIPHLPLPSYLSLPATTPNNHPKISNFLLHTTASLNSLSQPLPKSSKFSFLHQHFSSILSLHILVFTLPPHPLTSTDLTPQHLPISQASQPYPCLLPVTTTKTNHTLPHVPNIQHFTPPPSPSLPATPTPTSITPTHLQHYPCHPSTPLHH